MPIRPRLVILTCLLTATPACADWKDDVGFTRLQQTFTTGVPTSVAGGVAQTEAPDGAGNYAPDADHFEFSGKTVLQQSGVSAGNGHANAVGAYFYGNATSLIPNTTQIDSYVAADWIGTGFLNYGTADLPLFENRRVQNHSWIGSLSGNDASITHLNKRLDYAINRDGFSCVVGVNGAPLPELLSQSYHTLSVGLVNGAHAAGPTAYDTPGRMKPDLVAFEGATSFSTPQVASAAGLISEKLRSIYSSSVNADYARITKAILLAGAAKEPLPGWSRADSSKPYDAVYGAGALNILLAYRILLSSGNVNYSSNSTIPASGWAADSVRTLGNSSTRTYFFDLPAGSAAVPFSAALVWHRAIDDLLNATIANLDLKLCAVEPNTFTVGDVIDSSVSSLDNVEHIYRTNLAPGRYALQVTRTSGSATSYALAWRTSPTVTVSATTPTARELDGSAALFTVTRTGATTSPLVVPLTWSGTAVSGIHYSTPPLSVLIPAGASAAAVTITPIADDLAQGDRTVTLTLATDYSLAAGTNASATVTIQDKPYEAWRFARFTAGERVDPAISGEAADPDADSLPNLLEYALGAEPKTTDTPAHTPLVGVADGRLTLTYTRPTTLPDATYAVEWSSDLQAWSTGGSTVETVSTTDNGNGTTTIVTRSVASLDTTPRQFFRLRVTRP